MGTNVGIHEYRPGQVEVAVIYATCCTSAEEAADAAVRQTAKYASERNVQEFYMLNRKAYFRVRGGQTGFTSAEGFGSIPYVRGYVTLPGAGREPLMPAMVRYSTAEILATPTTRRVASLAPEAAASSEASILGGHNARLLASANNAKQFCDSGSRPACLHADALNESIRQLVGAIGALNAGRSVADVRSEADKTFKENEKLMTAAGLTGKLAGDCWYEGGTPCQRVHDVSQSNGIKAVGTSWGAFLIVEVLSGNTSSINLPK